MHMVKLDSDVEHEVGMKSLREGDQSVLLFEVVSFSLT